MAALFTTGPLRCSIPALGQLVVTSRSRAISGFYAHRVSVRKTACLQYLQGFPLFEIRQFSIQPTKPPHKPSETVQELPINRNSGSPSKPSPSNSVEHADEEKPLSSDPAVPNPTITPEDELPSLTESRRDRISAAIQGFMDNMFRAATEASNWASNATGTSYRGIERLKAQNAELEAELARAREGLGTKRKEYQSVVQRRLQTQREVNTLLARKDGWTPGDLERFTSLYRDDHTLDSSVAKAGEELAAAERHAEKIRERLISGILGRYHEEQIWSDRIRRLSTWGTWGLMGVNVLLFLAFQFGAEPWRRKKLVKGFEDKVAEGVKKAIEDERLQAVTASKSPDMNFQQTEKDKAVPDVDIIIETPSDGLTDGEIQTEEKSPAHFLEDAELPLSPKMPETWAHAWTKRKYYFTTERWKDVALDLVSERLINLRMRDASALVAEGAVAGAILSAGVMFWVLQSGT